MSTNEARGFLENILAHPDDDAPRLIYADWLEEHGDSERAEFIRVQIERTLLPEWDARQVRLRLRERELLGLYGMKWKWELPNIEGIEWQDFRRGFMGTATFSSFNLFRTNAHACWAATPLEAASIPWPSRHDSLDIEPIFGLKELTLVGKTYEERELDCIAQAPLLSTLRVLNLRECSLGSEGIRRLLVSPHMGNLKAMRMRDNYIGNDIASSLVDAVSLSRLEELDCSISYRYHEDLILTAVGVLALTTWNGMNRLRSLNLSGNAIERGGLRTLLRSPNATGLKTLKLRDNGLNAAAMQEFGAAHSELQLDVLDLGANVLLDLGAAELAKAPCLRALKVLELDRCEIPTAGARRLAKAPFFDTLRHLNANHNSFGPEGLLALLERNPPELHTLQLVNNDLTYKGVAHLASSPASDVLLKLNLALNHLGKHAVQSLAKTNHLRNLLHLRLNGTRIGMADGVDLEESPLGKRLAVLELEDEDEEETAF